MQTEGGHPIDPRGPPQGLAALAMRLINDARDFATAELNLIKATAGERATYAAPGFVMLLVALVLVFGLIVALVVTAMVWLAAETGPLLAMLIVTVIVLGIVALLGWLGTGRIKGALRPRERR